MTDQNIPADQARRARQWARDTLDDVENGANVSAYARDAARTLIAMMPRPTLADMTPEERAACQWMQADVKGYEITAGIIAMINPTDAHLIASDGETWFLEFDTVTPRPDLPRMEWPSTGQDGEEAAKVDYVSVAGGRTAYGPWTVARLRKKADPAPAPAPPEGWRLADHETHGRGVVTTPTPNSDGRVCFAIPSGSPLGYNWHLCYPDELTYLDQEADTPDTVPPNTLAEGSEWEDVDALARACRESGRDQIVVIDNSEIGRASCRERV